MDRIHTAPPTRRNVPFGARLSAVVLATVAALLLSVVAAISPASPPESRTSAVEDSATTTDALAVRSLDDTCLEWSGDTAC